jgi:PPP family 3-phenylpropionic acid transporter
VASLGFVGAHGRLVLVATMVAFAAFRAPLLSLVDALALDRGRYGRIRLWGSAGFLVAVLAGGWLHDRVGVLYVMLGCSAALVVASVVAFGLPAPPLEARPRIFAEWRKMLAQRRLWLFLVAVWLTQSACAIYDSGFSLHLSKLGFDGRFVSQAWAVGVGAEVILMWGAHILLQRVRAQRLLAVGAAVSGARWFLLARAHAGAVILLLQPLHAISFGLTYVAGVHVMRDRAGGTPTAAQGLYAMVMMVGSISGMTVAGWLLERLGGQGMFDVASAVALSGAGCALACADLS